ncbi:MAG: YARHG domain-containing protein [Cyclobacteriaceae bacterium]|nr:YARHG domain-containing protein [Chitinophagaceae bacterium]MBY0436058.1 YARHG domain-containing protein [Cyclobacteriaceae bacterium]
MKKMNLHRYIFFSIVVAAHCSFGQGIETYYEFVRKKDRMPSFISDDLWIGVDYKLGEKRSKGRKLYLYSYKKNLKTDSVFLPEGFDSSGLLPEGIISKDGDIFFCTHSPMRLIKVNRHTGKFQTKEIFNLDSISIKNLIGDKLITGSKRYLINLYDPQKKTSKVIFDYAKSVDDRYKDDIGTENPVGIGSIFSFATGSKILIKTGYNESDGSFDCIYYIIDTKTDKIDKLPFSHFEPLIAEPRDNLRKQPKVRMDTFSIDIRNVYFDVYDSVGYIPYHFYYDYKVDKNHTSSRLYAQDAFVVNRDFNLIGRALERKISVSYPIYENGKKSWSVISSSTDSLKNSFFKIKLDYKLEKAFYNIFHNRTLKQTELNLFDKYELSLLKNFILAKHNFKFMDNFYQSYFNTFVFYGNDEKRKSRINNPDKLFSTSDRTNLVVINKALSR